MNPDHTPTATRSRYIDTLRATAIVRVYLHHTLWIGWLTVVFPSMPIMFALAGHLMAVSLDRGGATRTVVSRVRRLLPPLWALAVIAVPLMLARGWHTADATPLRWSDLTYWVVPLANPPASSWGGPFAMALWYLRAYLWLVLLSPLLWWAFRRRPVLTLLAPLAYALLLYFALVPVPEGRAFDVAWSTATYGTCWVLGFARHTRLIDRLSGRACALLASALAVAGLAWGAWSGVMFADPIAEMLWGIAFVLVAMRLRPSFGWLDRIPWLSRLVAALNARAVTIYVWHLPMLFAAVSLLGYLGIEDTTSTGRLATLVIGTLLTTMAVFATGWIEDLAARRRPALIPSAGAGPTRWPRPEPVRA